MITKELTLSHSVNEIKETLKKISTNHSSEYKKLEFQDSFSMIKIIGTIMMGAIVTIELYYEQIEDSKTKVKITYTGSGTKQSINEANEASFERDFSKYFIKYITGEVDIQGKAEVPVAETSFLSVLIFIFALIGVLFGLYVLISN